MTKECYQSDCRFHSQDGPYCDEPECRYEEHLKEKIKEMQCPIGIHDPMICSAGTCEACRGVRAALKAIEAAKYHTCPNCGHSFRD